MTRRHSSRETLSISFRKNTPAQLTSTSRRPNSRSTTSTAAFTASSRDMSHCTKRPRLPAPRTASSVVGVSSGSRESDWRSHRTKSAPSSANRTATARPIPELLPVTIATRSLSRAGEFIGLTRISSLSPAPGASGRAATERPRSRGRRRKTGFGHSSRLRAAGTR